LGGGSDAISDAVFTAFDLAVAALGSAAGFASTTLPGFIAGVSTVSAASRADLAADARAGFAVLDSAGALVAAAFAGVFDAVVFSDALLLTVLFDACGVCRVPAPAALAVITGFFAEVAAGLPADRDADRAAADADVPDAATDLTAAAALAGDLTDFAADLTAAGRAAGRAAGLAVVGLTTAFEAAERVADFADGVAEDFAAEGLAAAFEVEGFTAALEADGSAAALEAEGFAAAFDAEGLAAARAADFTAAAFAAGRTDALTETGLASACVPTPAFFPTIAFLIPTASPFEVRDSKIVIRRSSPGRSSDRSSHPSSHPRRAERSCPSSAQAQAENLTVYHVRPRMFSNS